MPIIQMESQGSEVTRESEAEPDQNPEPQTFPEYSF